MSVQPLTGSYVCRHMTDWIAIFDHVVSSFQITQCNLMTLRDIFKSGDRLLINRQLCLFWNRLMRRPHCLVDLISLLVAGFQAWTIVPFISCNTDRTPF